MAHIRRPNGSQDPGNSTSGGDGTGNGSAGPRDQWASPKWTPQPDTDQAVAFLDHHMPGGDWLLIAIHPETGKIEADRFDDADRMHDWIERRQGIFNFYYVVGATPPGLNKKPRKTDITAVTVLWADIDPPDTVGAADLGRWQETTRDRLKAYHRPPSDIVRSGNGFNCLWRLAEPFAIENDADIDHIEASNRWLAQSFGADDCWNIDRILRLPGTINVPTEKKREKGRVRALAELIESNARTYHLDDFEPAQRASSSKQRTDGERTSSSTGNDDDERPAIDDPDLEQIIKDGYDQGDPRRWGSRSEAVFYVAAELIRRQWADMQIAALLLDPRLGISDHCLSEKDPERAAWRAINNTHADMRRQCAGG